MLMEKPSQDMRSSEGFPKDCLFENKQFGAVWVHFQFKNCSFIDSCENIDFLL